MKNRKIFWAVAVGILLLIFGASPAGIGRVMNSAYGWGESQTVRAGDGATMGTVISLNKSVPTVNFVEDATAMDQAVYKALKIAVADDHDNEVSFQESDIEFNYNRTAGRQSVLVHYKGNASYKESYAEATVNIVQAQATRVVLATNPSAVTLQSDKAAMDGVLASDLAIQVVDVSSNKINFSMADLSLTYNLAAGTQDVTVRYKGNDSYAPSLATANVKITDPIGTRIVVDSNNVKVRYQDSATDLDNAVIKALGIRVQTTSGEAVAIQNGDLVVTYNHVAGTQPVTIHYKGSDHYTGSDNSASVIIVDPQPVNIVLNGSPGTVPFESDPSKLDTAVLKALSVKLVDNDDKDIPFTTGEISLVYDRAKGDQQVTVSYKGNDDYAAANAVTTIHIGDSVQETQIYVGAMVAIFAAIAVVLFVLYTHNKKKQAGENPELKK